MDNKKPMDFFMITPTTEVDGKITAETLGRICDALSEFKVVWDDRGAISFIKE